MKKFELHLDAIITVIVVFALAMSFILFQRHQYSVLLQDNIDLAWDKENLEVNLQFTTSLLDKCKNEKEDGEKIGLYIEATDSFE